MRALKFEVPKARGAGTHTDRPAPGSLANERASARKALFRRSGDGDTHGRRAWGLVGRCGSSRVSCVCRAAVRRVPRLRAPDTLLPEASPPPPPPPDPAQCWPRGWLRSIGFYCLGPLCAAQCHRLPGRTSPRTSVFCVSASATSTHTPQPSRPHGG